MRNSCSHKIYTKSLTSIVTLNWHCLRTDDKCWILFIQHHFQGIKINLQTQKLIQVYYCLFQLAVQKNNQFTGLFNGYLCFFVSIAFIGVCTAVIGDVAAQLGCFIYLKDSVNAIAFVALGTSVPGISKTHDTYLVSQKTTLSKTKSLMTGIVV